ncbi:MAG: PAS domain S-box protein [Microcoleus sp. PH2017_25_DOB_D_A]|uniref:PAS domain-containing protein n=1 Tax=unclassified Microcoleus TaxID=2642155 RepID=UPI001DD6B265|nr:MULTISPECIES: PAS domain-containing protein [unclassified Microcoleus]TAE12147.1 MAG: PAS domain S-box protein [Oscillatoriales cyanobacterium]MCC3533278.1 PAS domain S-box protein [Microcoleus sp. PH2017_25_DOB_D_A]MCC3547437.1 PAS domain S-box protein [Microcoleus sp. PH2017_24_DOB_U_A]TAE26303.1 MAG: PAS domain S-box protein [Oscillatoriales cyanobacterium]TAE44983.1 MAG: PAS domain S-box protein [Oscillatoriales cyanobacterium]
MEFFERSQKVQPPSTPIAALQSFSKKAGIAVIAIGCTVMLGWIFDLQLLKSIFPELPSMKANTAFCFILSGLSLFLQQRRRAKSTIIKPQKIDKALIVSSSLLIILISLFTLIQYSSNLDLGIDQLLFKDNSNLTSISAPGRMAPNTATAFLLQGTALLLLSLRRPKYLRVQILSCCAFLIAYLGLIGYIYGKPFFYTIGYTGMALHTSVAFMLLSLGILFASPERGLIAVIVSDRAGGIMARRLLPQAMVIPTLAGYFIISGERLQAYSPELGISLLSILNAIVFTVLIWQNAKSLCTADRRRYRTQLGLIKAKSDLESQVEKRTLELQLANEQLQQQILDSHTTEQALQKNYNLLLTVINSTPTALFVKDIQGCYMMLNAAGASIIGKSFDDIIGRDDSELFPAEIAANITKTDRQIVTAGKTQVMEEELPVQGKLRTFLSTKNAYRDGQGKISGIVSIARDITDRKQAEVANRSLAAILEATPDFVGICDLDGHAVYMNKAGRKMVGIDENEDISNKQVGEFAAASARSTFQQAIATAISGGVWSGETAFVSASGVEIPVSQVIISHSAPDGQLAYISTIARDISDRFQAETALRLSEQRYRSLIAATAQLVWITDAQGKPIAPTDWMAYTGQSLEEATNNWFSAIHPDDRDLTLQAWMRAVETKNLYEVEHRLRASDGSYRHFWVRAVPVLATDGSIREWVGTHTDISDRVQVLEALKQSAGQYRSQAAQLEKAFRDLHETQAQLIQTEKISSLGQLVAGVAHEINNPINFIYGNITHASQYAKDLLNLLNLYQEKYPNPVTEIALSAEEIEIDYLIEDFPKILESMKVGADRIRDLVVSLRNFSRLDESQMKRVDIHEGIESTLVILQHKLKANAVRPAIEIIKNYGSFSKVECYAGQLNQVFMNLLANAIDALEEYNSKRSPTEIYASPNTIQINTSANSDTVTIRIADNGMGINPEVMSKLFDPFFTTKPVGKGTGLGLSISYQIIVEKHRGKLKCVSAPGKGAEFIIEIPISQNLSAQATENIKEKEMVSSNQSLVISH